MMYKTPQPLHRSLPALGSITENSSSPHSLSPPPRHQNGRTSGPAYPTGASSQGHVTTSQKRKVSIESRNDAEIRNGERKSFPFARSPGETESRRLSLNVRSKQRDEEFYDRRRSLPPVAHGPVEPKMGPAPNERTKGSITEVVARMRVREQTLMGDDLLRKRDRKSSTVSKPSGSRHASVDEGRDSAIPTSRAEWLLNGGAAKVGKSPRNIVRRFGCVKQEPQKVTLADLKNELRLLVERFEPPPPTDVPADILALETERSLSCASSIDSDRPPAKVPFDVYDSDFDFDEGEEEISTKKQAGQRAKDTESVYNRACAHLRVLPSPAFLRQCGMSVVHLRDVNLTPVDVKAISIALVRDARIVVLDLSYNDLGPIGVCYVAEMLQENSFLDDLDLSSTNPGREGIEALLETLQHNKSLSTLRLEENRIEHTESHFIADMIRKVPSLRALHLAHNRLGYHGGVMIATAVAKSTTLTTLDLQWNHIRRDSAVCLARALATNTSLRILNLAWNGLGKEGCLALGHALPRNKTLWELDITCNRVDLMSLGFFLNGMLKNKDLRTLKIGQNPLTTEGAKALIRAVIATPDLELKEINLKGVPVDHEFTGLVSKAQETRVLKVIHEEAFALAMHDQKRDHEGTDLSRFDPVHVLFEYMKLDNLRVIDMFQFMDAKKRDRLSRNDVRTGLNTLRIPVTEHAIDVMMEALDLNRDGFVELDEMMKVQRETARQIKLRFLKARAKGKEDVLMNDLRQILRDIIKKRKDDNESQSRRESAAAKTRRKSSAAGLQVAQARYSTAASSRRGSILPPTSEVAE